ncbi:transcriptional regulator [Catellatospora sp. KI3]|uniref:transcriptional regulator n=1 Tax=Catellatospora sp. KI3 TaxID=3041620 RepID=UPI0024831846|nr:transcriptional regulator [Catellatospora sp. KI3]MDI1460624.1 transcriptional regulator [Catellatospora sp. KI3]
MTHSSPTGLLVLHAVRLRGFADTAAVAARFGLDPAQTGEDLLDAQAYGWVTRSSFSDLSGWSLTGSGYQRNTAQLRDELGSAAAEQTVSAVHDRFVPLNAEATQAFTAWQLDSGRPADILRRLADLADELRELEQALTAHLDRFGGYHDRFAAALARSGQDPAWITGIEVDSCHRIWFELHEDLIATLGIVR